MKTEMQIYDDNGRRVATFSGNDKNGVFKSSDKIPVMVATHLGRSDTVKRGERFGKIVKIGQGRGTWLSSAEIVSAQVDDYGTTFELSFGPK